MKVKKDNLKRAILFLILFCVITLIALNVIVIARSSKQNTITNDGDRPDRYLKLNGFSVFFEKYTGSIESSEVSHHLNDLATEYLPNMYAEVKNLKEIDREAYFENNASDFENYLGIEEFAEFQNFFEKLETTGVDVADWERLTVDKESFVNNSNKAGYAYAEFEVSFKNDQTIRYSLYVAKSKTKKPRYIIGVIE